jgi:hypothetical protein
VNKELTMKLDSVGEIIATRTLTRLQDQGPPTEVLVSLGKPHLTPGYSDYYCAYQITGAGSERIMHSCVVDPFQARQLSLSTLGVELEVLNKDLGGRLRWDCDEKGDLGFPTRPSY